MTPGSDPRKRAGAAPGSRAPDRPGRDPRGPVLRERGSPAPGKKRMRAKPKKQSWHLPPSLTSAPSATRRSPPTRPPSRPSTPTAGRCACSPRSPTPTPDDSRLLGAYYDVPEDAFWVPGHIPGRPIFPGVLMVEAGAQLCSYSCITAFPEIDFMGFAGVDAVKFRGQVAPGDRLYLALKQVELKSGGASATCRVSSGARSSSSPASRACRCDSASGGGRARELQLLVLVREAFAGRARS